MQLELVGYSGRPWLLSSVGKLMTMSLLINHDDMFMMNSEESHTITLKICEYTTSGDLQLLYSYYEAMKDCEVKEKRYVRICLVCSIQPWNGKCSTWSQCRDV